MARLLAPILLLLVGVGAVGDMRAHGKSHDGELSWIFVRESLGNITGVLVTAFLLIPRFATSELLVGWFGVSIACVIGSLVAAKGSQSTITERITP